MVIRPFPLPLRTGIDVCKISRIAQAIATTRGVNRTNLPATYVFASRWMTPFEILLALRRFPGQEHWQVTDFTHAAPEAKGLLQHLAARWAAKEAIIKAWSVRIVMREVEIHSTSNAPPHGVVYDDLNPTWGKQDYQDVWDWRDHHDRRIVHAPVWAEAKKKWMVSNHGYAVPISISHDGDYVVASAIAQTMTLQSARSYERNKRYNLGLDETRLELTAARSKTGMSLNLEDVDILEAPPQADALDDNDDRWTRSSSGVQDADYTVHQSHELERTGSGKRRIDLHAQEELYGPIIRKYNAR